MGKGFTVVVALILGLGAGAALPSAPTLAAPAPTFVAARAAGAPIPAQARLVGPGASFQLPDGRLQEDFTVTFFGVGVPLDMRFPVDVIYDPAGLSATQLAAAYRQAATDATIALAVAKGFTVTRTDVYLPQVQRGQ